MADQINSFKNITDLEGDYIGNILLDSGKITRDEMERIMAAQKKEGTLFGETALRLGILTEEEVAWALASQYSYPYMPSGDKTVAKEVLCVHQPFSPQVESFRSIRSGLVLSGAGKILKVIGMISPHENEGRSFSAANLASVFAQLGSKTILVDINFRKPRIHEIFHLKNNCGLSTLLIKRTSFDQALQHTPIPCLDVLPTGPKPPNPVELLGWPETKELLHFLKTQYDIVIVDTPAFLKTSDARMIATLCDGVILVAVKGRTTHGAIDLIKKQLDQTGAKIMGAIINEIRENRPGSGGYSLRKQGLFRRKK